MAGYCDEKREVYIHDNSKVDIQIVPYNDLMLAWGEDYPGLSRKNALFALRFNKELSDIEEIIHNGLKKRAEAVLNPPIKNLGVPGIRKLSADFYQWKNELDNNALLDAYKHFVTYTGSIIPALPKKLSGFNTETVNPHHGARDSFAQTLIEHKNQFGNGNSSWSEAATLFEKSGNIISNINEIITNSILGIKSDLKNVPNLLNMVADYEEEAFGLFLP